MTQDRPNRLETGSTLLLTVMLLLMLGLVGVAALQTVSRDQQVAGLQNRKKIALYAAEAGIAAALAQSITNPNVDPVVPAAAQTLGDAGLYPHGLPSFRADPTVADATENLGTRAMNKMSLNIGQGGTSSFQNEFWRIRVQGQAPGGTIARIEAVTSRIISN